MSSTRAPLDPRTATSRTLIAGIRGRDPEAWDRLVALYAPFVLETCRRARLPDADAHDVFQEVFQAAFRRIETFEKRRREDTFRGWLRTITKHKIVDHFRRQEREPRGEGGTEVQRRMAGVRAREDDREEPEAAQVEGDQAQKPDGAEVGLLHQAVEGLRTHFHERTWRAFCMTAIDGRPPADVGEELGMSTGAVRVAKSRVLQRLRSELGDLA